MIKILRDILSLFIALALSVAGLPAAASDQNDARRAAQMSQQMARKVAEDMFRFYLVQSLDQSLSYSAASENLLKSLRHLENGVAKNRGEINRLAENTIEALVKAESEMLSHAEIRSRLNKVMTEYHKALVEFRQNRHLRMSAMEYTRQMKAMAEKITAKLQAACSQGLGAEFTIPNMPPIHFRPPNFEIGFTMGFDANGVTNASPNYSADYSDLFGKEAGEYAAAGTVVGGALVYMALTSALIGMAPGFAAAGLAGLIVLVILVAITMIIDGINRGKATKAADNVEWAIRNKGNSTHVANAFKDICSKDGAAIAGIGARIGELEKAERGSPAWVKFEKERAVSSEVMNKLMALIQDLGVATERLKKENEKPKGKKSAKDLNEALAEAPESKALQEYITKNVSLTQLSRVFEVQMIDLSLGSDQALKLILASKEFKENGGLGNPEKRFAQIEQQIRALQKLSYQQSLIEQNPQALEKMQDEVRSFADQRELYIEWTKTFSQYLGDLFGLRSTTDTLARLQGLLVKTRELREKNPDSLLLKLIEQRIVHLAGA